MATVQQFREEHRELGQIATQLSRRLSPASVTREAHAVRLTLSQLVSKLQAHLAMEDEHLYPKLLAHTDEAVRDLARQYVDEMGGLRERIRDYDRRWISASAIAGSPQAFMQETEVVLAALAERVQREDRQLYPLVEP